MVAATPITITLFWQMQWHWYIVIMITTTITTKITWMWVYWLLQFPLYQDDSAQKDVIVKSRTACCGPRSFLCGIRAIVPSPSCQQIK